MWTLIGKTARANRHFIVEGHTFIRAMTNLWIIFIFTDIVLA
jgi:hypothetical protein